MKRATSMVGGIYVPNQSAVVTLNGEPVFVEAGVTRIRAGHPLLDGNEDLFSLVSDDVDYE